MQQVLTILAMVLLTGTVHAAQYNCRLSDGTANDPKAVTYAIDTAKEDNKMVDLGAGAQVGCVVLRTAPALMTCGLGSNGRFSIFATADEGSSVLALSTDSSNLQSQLICIKH